MLRLKVNGMVRQVETDGETPLLWVLRDHLGMTETKYCCGIGECGACAVHVNGRVVLSCQTPVKDVVGKEIATIRGLKGPIADSLFDAWIAEQVPQCGYCQPGQIMTAAALLSANPNPGTRDIEKAMSAVICRCGTYPAIERAIRRAAGTVAK